MRKRPKQWVDFMMRFELGLETPNPKRARISAAVIAGGSVRCISDRESNRIDCA